MSEVLVLGNGISRLGYASNIASWNGEIWGCNRAYLDYPKTLTRLTGHTEVLIEAEEYRREHPECGFTIWSGHLGHVGFGDKFTCPARFRTDSGTTWIAQALEEGHSVAACGFDLGGWDIHSPGLERQDKTQWVKRWRSILKHYGYDRIRFIGHDHLPFLLSDTPASEYRVRYQAGKPHIADADYLQTWEKWTGQPAVLVPGRIGKMAKVRFKNGYETEMRETLAMKMVEKGRCELVEKPKQSKPEPKVEKTEKPRRKVESNES